MIVRVLTARVRAGKVASFNALFRRQVALLREQRGLDHLTFARRFRSDGEQEAVLIEEWQDAQSLYAWVGPNLSEPRLIPGTRELIEDVAVVHYEALADAIDEPSEFREADGAETGGAVG